MGGPGHLKAIMAEEAERGLGPSPQGKALSRDRCLQVQLCIQTGTWLPSCFPEPQTWQSSQHLLTILH